MIDTKFPVSVELMAHLKTLVVTPSHVERLQREPQFFYPVNQYPDGIEIYEGEVGLFHGPISARIIVSEPLIIKNPEVLHGRQ